MKELKLRRRQLGIFGSIFGKKSKEKSTTDSTKNTTSTGTAEKAGSSESVTKLLDDPVREAANALVVNMLKMTTAEGGGADDADIMRLAKLLDERAQDAESVMKGNNAATLTAARRAGEKAITRLNTDLAQSAGGTTKNSFVAGATAEAIADLEVNMAGLESDLNLKARNLQTEEINAAIEAFQKASVSGATDANAIASLLGVLRGAQATQSTDENEIIKSTENITEILNAITKGKTKSSGFELGFKSE